MNSKTTVTIDGLSPDTVAVLARLDRIEQKLAVIACCLPSAGRLCGVVRSEDESPEGYRVKDICIEYRPCPEHQPEEFARLMDIALSVEPQVKPHWTSRCP